MQSDAAVAKAVQRMLMIDFKMPSDQLYFDSFLICRD
tara:strand:- start:1772 stop:1882 length:111 start_codon:yes stop_codon:yes gene_type:complete